jgi:PilZ domain-containing protein/predicted nucleotide-binding protein with TIR-like domain
MSMSPKLFIASTAEGHRIAELLEAGLHDVADVTSWREETSAPSSFAFERLVDAAGAFDFAVFVLLSEREDGVLLHLGVFLGALGPERIAVVSPTSGAFMLPTELRGATCARYAPPLHGNDLEALEPVCATIKEHLGRVTTPARPAGAAPRPSPDSYGQVARRMRRSLGTACSVRPGRTLRIADISLTGALIETFGEIPENQLLELDLALENGRNVRVTAKVVRVQHPQWGRVGGVGVQFVRFEGESLSILEEFLETDPARSATTASRPGFPTPAA